MAGKKTPSSDSQNNPLGGGGFEPPRGSGDDRRGAARQPGETRGSGDDR